MTSPWSQDYDGPPLDYEPTAKLSHPISKGIRGAIYIGILAAVIYYLWIPLLAIGCMIGTICAGEYLCKWLDNRHAA